jgi:UDPglucose 6-dehydrogenase
MKDTLSVVGLGRLGLPFLLSFAAKGYKMIGLDIDKNKIDKIQKNQTYLFEPEIKDLIKKYKKNITVTTEFKSAIESSSITFIVVQTPSMKNGNFSLKHIQEACNQIGKILKTKKERHTVVITSTISPGSMIKIQDELEKMSKKKVGIDIGLCYAPEFIALGQVIGDIRKPNFILIGESDKNTGKTLAKIRKSISTNNPELLRTNFINAEIAKLALNTYITTKMSFANMIARICEQSPGADAREVSNIVGSDSRVGKEYLVGSIAYGGPCFPRDNKALSGYLESINLKIQLPKAIDDFNENQNDYLYSLIKKFAKKTDVIGILGLTYKPNTNVADQSPGKLLAEMLLKSKYNVIGYDPAYKISLIIL